MAVVLLANFFLGGGKCPNLGVVNVRILGVVNVLLANDSQSLILTQCQKYHPVTLDNALEPTGFLFFLGLI